MIEFGPAAAEIRSLIARRRELATLLGSTFVAAGVFLDNAIGGKLPRVFGEIERHLSAYYAAFLLVPSLILALRMVRLQGGMVYHGMLYARTLRDAGFDGGADVERAARVNFAGVSFLQCALAGFIAGFSAAVMAVAVGLAPWVGLVAAGATAAAVMAAFFINHRRAVGHARTTIARDEATPPGRAEWAAHIAASLHDANAELIGLVGFVGLILFSVMEVLSGLGQIGVRSSDLDSGQIERYGPPAYTILMVVTAAVGLAMYLRIRVAVGRFSALLDPTDRPFRALVPTDSLLGYLLLAFFLAASVHLAAIQSMPDRGRVVLVLDATTLALALLAEQATLIIAARRLGGG